MISKKIVQEAKREALKSNQYYKLGAAIYDRRGQILAHGHNALYSKNLTIKISSRHKLPVIRTYSIHAEAGAVIDFIKKYNKYPGQLYLYVHRINHNGESRLARPCDYCWELIEKCGIKFVDYSRSER